MTETRVMEPEVLAPEEIVANEEAALTKAADQAFLLRVEQMENAMVLLERRGELLDRARLIGVKNTRPEDWILSKGKDGIATAMLAASGAEIVSTLFGIQLTNVRPLDKRGVFEPEKIPVEGRPGVFTFRAWADAHSLMTGRAIESLEFSRRSDEDFIGRSTDAEGKLAFKGPGYVEGDIRSAIQTGLRTKACRVLAGMSKVPPAELDRAWAGTGKSSAQCRKGSGFGSSGERAAQDGADSGISSAAAALWKDILRRVGGDEDAAHGVLRDITKYPAAKDGKYQAFAGCKSWQEINTEKRLNIAKEKLAQHSQFGDQAGGEREPGED